MLPEFTLLMPQTLPEALEMLAEGRPGTTPLAGGTNLVPDLRSGRHRPSILVNIAGLDELRGIRRDNGHVMIGAGTTIAQVLAESAVAEHGLALKQAAAVFASPLVRNRATVGGNLRDASPAADMAPPLLVLGANVELANKDGLRIIPLDEFFVHVRKTICQPQELLTAVRWPAPTPHSASRFRKVGLRKADAISVLSVAVMVEWSAEGTCSQARIALGAVAPTPLRAPVAEEALLGQRLTVETIAEAAHLAGEAARPIDDVRGSTAYRRRVTEVLVRRLLTEIAEEVK